MKLLVAIIVFCACSPQVIDLSRADAHNDAQRMDGSNGVDASPVCVCRISNCRSTSDCGAGGSTCGDDGYCTGDLGTCDSATDTCSAIGSAIVCTASSTSTAACSH